jgi:hypothetical protein
VKQFSEDVYNMVCYFLKEQLKRIVWINFSFKSGKTVSETHDIIASGKASFRKSLIFKIQRNFYGR